MKRLVISVLLAVTLLCGCGSSAKPEHDFRNADWGMTKSEVIASEGKEPDADIDEEGSIEYTKIMVADLLPMTASYEFDNERLVSGRYYFNNLTQDTTAELTINKVSLLQAKLTELYKEPFSIEGTLPDEILDSDEIKYVVKWKTDDSQISLVCFKLKDTHTVSLHIVYSSKSEVGDPDSKEGL